MNGIIGKKVGMTRIFDEDGRQIPVTVVEVAPCHVVQTKTKETDGYNAIQIGYGERLTRKQVDKLDGKGGVPRASKADIGHCKKAGLSPRRLLKEFRVDDPSQYEVGGEINISMFDGVTYVDIAGQSKGRGFQGVVRRWGMSGGRASHGSGNHRGTGSIGQCTFPSRVFKNRKMPGQMGNVNVTKQNLKVVALRAEDNVLLINGAVPGPNGGMVTIFKALKKPVKKS